MSSVTPDHARPRPRLTVDSTAANANASPPVSRSPGSLIPVPVKNANGKRSNPTTPTDRIFPNGITDDTGAVSPRHLSPGASGGKRTGGAPGMSRRASSGNSKDGSPGSPRRILTKYEHHQQTLANQAALSRTPSPSPQSTLLPDATASDSSSPFPGTLTLPPDTDQPFVQLDPDHPDYTPYVHTNYYRRISDLIKDPKSLFHRREWSEEGYIPPGSEGEPTAGVVNDGGALGAGVLGKGEVEHIEEGEGLEVRFREMGLKGRAA